MCLAGEAVHGLGVTIQLPYLTWSPSEIAALPDDERISIRDFLRERRKQIIDSVKK